MLILYPKPPSDPSIPQWWGFSLEINRRLKSFSMLWRLGPISLHFQKNVVIDVLVGEFLNTRNFERPSRFYVIRLNNPDKLSPGRTAKIIRLVCMDCKMEYPCPADLDTDVKCDCSIIRRNCVMLWWNRNPSARLGESLYRSSHEFTL
jgi:hypothetical protein